MISDVFDKLRSIGSAENLDSLYYADVDYTSLVRQHFCMDKDWDEMNKNVNERGVVKLVVHAILAT